jgi:hypothetical protein
MEGRREGGKERGREGDGGKEMGGRKEGEIGYELVFSYPGWLVLQKLS